MINGFVQLRGAMYTGGTNDLPFTLPSAFRPVNAIWIPVDLCNAHYGRLWITSNGAVEVQFNSETSDWSDASCFTSLEGVSFPK